MHRWIAIPLLGLMIAHRPVFAMDAWDRILKSLPGCEAALENDSRVDEIYVLYQKLFEGNANPAPLSRAEFRRLMDHSANREIIRRNIGRIRTFKPVSLYEYLDLRFRHQDLHRFSQSKTVLQAADKKRIFTFTPQANDLDHEHLQTQTTNLVERGEPTTLELRLYGRNLELIAAVVSQQLGVHFRLDHFIDIILKRLDKELTLRVDRIEIVRSDGGDTFAVAIDGQDKPWIMEDPSHYELMVQTAEALHAAFPQYEIQVTHLLGKSKQNFTKISYIQASAARN